MQKMREGLGTDRMQAALRFTAIRMASRPETAPLVPIITQARAELTATDTTWLDAREARVAATAEIVYCDSLLDDVIMALSREVLAMTGGDRSDARYKLLFPVAPSKVTEPVGAETELRMVRAMLGQLKDESKLAPLRSHVEPLTTRLTSLEQSLANRQELYVPESQAGATRTVVMDKVRRLYNTLWPRVTLMFPDDPALVESFFATIYVDRRDAGDEQD